jgi:hypothetical protein
MQRAYCEVAWCVEVWWYLGGVLVNVIFLPVRAQYPVIGSCPDGASWGVYYATLRG